MDCLVDVPAPGIEPCPADSWSTKPEARSLYALSHADRPKILVTQILIEIDCFNVSQTSMNETLK